MKEIIGPETFFSALPHLKLYSVLFHKDFGDKIFPLLIPNNHVTHVGHSREQVFDKIYYPP